MIGPGTTLAGAKSRRPYTLGTAIARGGEGTVFHVAGNPALVAKIYARAPDRIRADKLGTLIDMSSPQLRSVSAWPEDMLVDGAGACVGFLMPAIHDGKPLHLFITPSDRAKYAPGLSYADLIGIAANLARAVTTFHCARVIMSDVNFSNFLVRRNGTTCGIDVDGMQIGQAAKFRATVGMEEFIPPELQGKRIADHPRTQNHDNFGLSVLIFLLLVQGRHPYSGNGGLPIGQAIAQRLHAVQKHGRKRTCPFCILQIRAEEILSDEIIGLFKTSFGSAGGVFDKYRPTAGQWQRALDAFARSLVVCGANPSHSYTSKATSCPWCRVEARGMPALFQSTPRSRLPPPPKPSLLGRLFGA